MNKFTNYALPFANAFDGHSFTCDHEELFAWTYGYIPEEGDPLIDSAHFDSIVNRYMPRCSHEAQQEALTDHDHIHSRHVDQRG